MGNMLSTTILTVRKTFKLTGDEKEDQKSDSKIFNEQINKMKRAIKPRALVYPNQIVDGQQISQCFFDKKELCLLQAIGLTQSGKTGVMFSCIQEFVNSKIHEPISISNIYVITGLSSNEWKDQTKARFPESIRDNIYHRNDLSKLVKSIQGKQNVLIIIDEVQIACGDNQTISTIMGEANLLNIQYLLENDVKIVEFSATPNGTFYDLVKWKKHSYSMKIRQGNGYTSCFDLMDNNRVKQCKPLDNLKSLDELLVTIKNYSTSRYHLIRTKTGEVGEHLIKFIKERYKDEDFEYQKYDMNHSYSEKDGDDINNQLLDNAPLKHTLIFIKEKARCAKTFTKEHIGIWYERYADKFSDDVVTQGLLGRATGYDDNGDSIIYTNISSIENYRKLWKGNFDKKLEWNSNSTKYTKGITQSKKTFNGEVTINGEVPNIPESSSDELPIEIVTEIHQKGESELIDDFWKRSKAQAKFARNPFKDDNMDESGFYKTSTTQNKKVYLLSEIENITKNWKGTTGFAVKTSKIENTVSGNTIQSRIYVCYKDKSELSKNTPIIYIRKLNKI